MRVVFCTLNSYFIERILKQLAIESVPSTALSHFLLEFVIIADICGMRSLVVSILSAESELLFFLMCGRGSVVGGNFFLGDAFSSISIARLGESFAFVFVDFLCKHY